MDCSPPGSSVHGILQVRILEWVAMPCSIKYHRLSVSQSADIYFSWSGGWGVQGHGAEGVSVG